MCKKGKLTTDWGIAASRFYCSSGTCPSPRSSLSLDASRVSSARRPGARVRSSHQRLLTLVVGRGLSHDAGVHSGFLEFSKKGWPWRLCGPSPSDGRTKLRCLSGVEQVALRPSLVALSVSCRGAGSLTPGTGTGQAGRGAESLLLRKEETVSPLTVFCLAPLKEWASRLFPGVPASPCLTVVALGRHFQARGREVASSSVPRTGSSEKED